MGKKATGETLKQLLLFIISSQMARQRCPCVPVAERQQRPFLCSSMATQGAKLSLHTKATMERAGKRWGQAGFLKGWQCDVGHFGVVGSNSGEEWGGGVWSQWTSFTLASHVLVFIPAGGRRHCPSSSSTTNSSCG